MATSKATEAYTVILIVRCSGEEHQLSAKNQHWNVKCGYGMQIWICTNVLPIIQCALVWISKLWNLHHLWARSTPRRRHQQSKRHRMIDRLHPYLSMSPCTSLLPLWDISREEAMSEPRPAFRAYRWRPPSVRYLWEENSLEGVGVWPQFGIKSLSNPVFSFCK